MVKTVARASEIAGDLARELNPGRQLERALDIAGDSASDLNPVKTLARACNRPHTSYWREWSLDVLASESDTVGVSVSALKPVNNLSVTSERGGASERNFPASLLMLSKKIGRASCREGV